MFRTHIASANRTVDLYTKNGGWGAYGTILVLIPDYNVGFSILSASAAGESPSTIFFLANIISQRVIPALEDVAREQARDMFAGTYTYRYNADININASSLSSSSSSSSDITLNSSLTITMDDNQPGLRVTRWTSNGTDFLNGVFNSAHLNPTTTTTTNTYVDFRLQPNNLYSTPLSPSPAPRGDGKAKVEVGFTGTWSVMPRQVHTGPFDLSCMSWGGDDTLTYGNVGIAQFVFELDPVTGRVVSVRPEAMRITLDKVNNGSASTANTT